MNTETTILVLLGLFLGLGGAFIAYSLWIRGPEDSFFVGALRATCWIYVRLVHRLRIEPSTSDPLPPEGAHIVVSNHRSGVDPIVLAVTTYRRVRFLMAREYYEIPVFRHVFRALQCIPVNRDGADLGATKAALRALGRGEVIGIFPQGGIREVGPPADGKSGVALLALRTGVPIVPFYVEGSPHHHSVLRAVVTPSRTVVHAGPPIRFDPPSEGKLSREDLERVTESILRAVAALAPARAPSAGEPRETGEIASVEPTPGTAPSTPPGP